MADALPIEELAIGDLGKKIELRRGESVIVGELTQLSGRHTAITHGRGDGKGVTSVRYDMVIDDLEVHPDPGATFIRRG